MKEYTNKEITVAWDPKKCVHSQQCVKGLPGVFDREKRPWIDMSGASSEEIKKVIDRCPSGALSYKEASAASERQPARIKVTKNGPLMVGGDCALIDSEDREVASCGPFALCRCGGSKNKPYCDGTHVKIGFDDTK